MEAIDNLIVVKVGTSTLTKNGKLDKDSFTNLGSQLEDLRQRDYHVIVVSSAAIAAGIEVTNSKSRAESSYDVVDYQRFASIGWGHLLNTWSSSMKDTFIGGLLLTRPALSRKDENNEAMLVISSLLSHNCVPVINENDAIFHEEITFGDNDQLAASLCVSLGQSALFGNQVDLVILSDVDGLYEDINNPSSLINEVRDLEAYAHLAGNSNGHEGTGGMLSKFMAAGVVMGSGINMYLANGREESAIQRSLDGEIGTRFICA
jgi:glutamate 5-kinase